MKSFLGVTGHYISNEWKLESVMLSCNRLSGRHTGENILQSYEEVASEFNIYTKVNHIVTDNASNMTKAFVTLPGFGDIDEAEEETSESVKLIVPLMRFLLVTSLMIVSHHSSIIHVLPTHFNWLLKMDFWVRVK